MAAAQQMTNCEACGQPIAAEALHCPGCGAPGPVTTGKKIIAGLIVIWTALSALLAIVVIGGFVAAALFVLKSCT